MLYQNHQVQVYGCKCMGTWETVFFSLGFEHWAMKNYTMLYQNYQLQDQVQVYGVQVYGVQVNGCKCRGGKRMGCKCMGASVCGASV